MSSPFDAPVGAPVSLSAPIGAPASMAPLAIAAPVESVVPAMTSSPADQSPASKAMSKMDHDSDFGEVATIANLNDSMAHSTTGDNDAFADLAFDDITLDEHLGEDFIPSTTFADLGVDADMVAALEAAGIMSPFPVQAATIPDALAGRDLCGRAPTGSGKTLAFGIPLMSRISRAEGTHPTGVILVPTRELATQVRDELIELGKVRKRYILAVYGGVPYAYQLNALNRGAALIVACPGRLLDLIEKGAVSLDKVEVAVIDEADRMADLGFMPDVRKLMSMMPKERQTLLFSATLDGDVDELISRHQKNPVRHDLVGVEDLGPAAVHKFELHSDEARLDRAVDLIKEHGSTMLFTMTREGSDELVDMLFDCGIRAVAIHGGRSQQQRERALKSFKTGRVQALVGTDVAARGIHVDGVNLVIHWDMPSDPKDYIHRSGRTARAGNGGLVMSLVDPRRERKARWLMRIVAPGQLFEGETQRPERMGNRPGSGRPNGGGPRRGGNGGGNGAPRNGAGFGRPKRYGSQGGAGGRSSGSSYAGRSSN